MLRLGFVLLAIAMLAGCANEPPQLQPQAQMVWLRLDRQRGAGNPALIKQFETDRRVCLGTTPQANAPSQPVDPAARACMAATFKFPKTKRKQKVKHWPLHMLEGGRTLANNATRSRPHDSLRNMRQNGVHTLAV
jgi:hypothetical protein